MVELVGGGSVINRATSPSYVRAWLLFFLSVPLVFTQTEEMTTLAPKKEVTEFKYPLMRTRFILNTFCHHLVKKKFHTVDKSLL